MTCTALILATLLSLHPGDTYPQYKTSLILEEGNPPEKSDASTTPVTQTFNRIKETRYYLRVHPRLCTNPTYLKAVLAHEVGHVVLQQAEPDMVYSGEQLEYRATQYGAKLLNQQERLALTQYLEENLYTSHLEMWQYAFSN